MRSMTSRDTEGRPRGWRLFHFQYSRNPLRCQAMTVSGLTMSNADRQPLQNRASHAHRNRSVRLKRSRWPRQDAGVPRADVGGQESRLAALHEFERLAEQKKTASE